MIDLQTDLENRGLIYQSNHAQEAYAYAQMGRQVAYAGFDCTAPSLHVGHLMPIMLLRRWQKAGHRPIVLFGSATTLVGDPTGKEQSRPILTPEDVQRNKASLSKIFSRFLNIDCPDTGVIFVDNAQWWEPKSYLSVLREIGSQITVNHMLHFETIARRIEQQQPLSFLEFNYMILQAYDFVHLKKTYGCSYQFGGSDQWGNMIMGTTLGHKLNQQDMFVFTSPLLTTADGRKMGKTEKGAVWLHEDYLSDFDYWQFWRNVDDKDCEKLLLAMTDLEVAEISELCQKDINQAKMRLAHEQTKLCRGDEAAEKASAQARSLFSDQSLASRKKALEAFSMGGEPRSLLDILVLIKAASSKSAARTLIDQKAVKIDDQLISDVFYQINPQTFSHDGILIAVGKKTAFLIVA